MKIQIQYYTKDEIHELFSKLNILLVELIEEGNIDKSSKIDEFRKNLR